MNNDLLVLNGEEFGLKQYNRTTNFTDGTISSTAYAVLSETSAKLEEIGATTITNLQIKRDDNVIYSLNNINAQITNIYENLYQEGIEINLTINFN